MPLSLLNHVHKSLQFFHLDSNGIEMLSKITGFDLPRLNFPY